MDAVHSYLFDMQKTDYGCLTPTIVIYVDALDSGLHVS